MTDLAPHLRREGTLAQTQRYVSPVGTLFALVRLLLAYVGSHRTELRTLVASVGFLLALVRTLVALGGFVLAVARTLFTLGGPLVTLVGTLVTLVGTLVPLVRALVTLVRTLVGRALAEHGSKNAGSGATSHSAVGPLPVRLLLHRLGSRVHGGVSAPAARVPWVHEHDRALGLAEYCPRDRP